ncbi:MAG: 30S ribosomal protein S12 methylthiotransferase RimO [Desulfobacteraceae bacterium]|nr:30S ribosomal protein S12 methylthiotransferase RimO [Desulfobacteraceae bacterium]
MQIYLSSLGCVRNRVDSEIMLGRLAGAGHEVCENPEHANVIVINTCAFIESATEEGIEEILTLSALKEKGSCRKIIVTGCLPQRYGRRAAESLPEVDVFLGTGAYESITEAVENSWPEGTCLLPSPSQTALPSWNTARIHDTWPTGYIKIMEGCARHCTYCIIPELRGPLRSRLADDIAREAGLLADNNFAEIILAGQDTTSWGTDLDTGQTLADLLDKVSEAAPDVWIRFLYGHPDQIGDRLLETVVKHPNMCRYFDIPIQHVSSNVLKRMGRGYGKKQLLECIERIRNAISDAVLRTTVLVGFPGETDADFEELLEFVEQVEFDHLGAFIYSDADDLAAHRLDGHLPPQISQDRHDLIMQRQADISLTKNRSKIGSYSEVLVEGRTDDGRFYGRIRHQAPEVDGITFIETDNAKIGTYMNLYITGADEYDLTGVPA